MISNRQWISLCLAGLCLGSFSIAQEGAAGSGGSSGSSGSGGSSGSSGSGTGSSGSGSGTAPDGSTTGGKPSSKPSDTGGEPSPDGTPADGTPSAGGGAAPTPGRSVDPFIPTTPKPDPNAPGASSAFGTPPPGSTGRGETPGTGADEPGPAGSSSAFGPGDSTSTQSAAPSFTLPGFFGGAPTTYTGGQGRLARPRFRFKVTTSQGYDDNVLQTPDDPFRIPDQQVLVDPGTPDTVTFVPVTTTTYEQAFAGPIIYYRPVTTTTFQPVVTKGREPVFRTIKGPEPQERVGSFVSRVGVRVDMQQATRRSLFTLDLNGSYDRYWNRPGQDGKDDFSGALAFAYLYNFTPRLTASVTANIAYISQPDLTRINTPDRLGAGDIVNALARLNLSYRATPRLTTTVSVGQNSVLYIDQGGSGVSSTNGDTFETTFSAEARYLWKPRYSLIAEFRHVLINYPDTPTLNAQTEVFLLGAEMRLSSRLSATVRLGQAIRIFEDTGETSSAPYAEGLLTYRISPTSSVQWNSRFGYEEPPGPGSETLSYRTTLSYSKNFTPRLSLSVGITGVSRNTSFSGADDQSEQTIEGTAAMEYRLTRQFSLNATFSYTKLISTNDFISYDRSRMFLGAEYEF